MITKNPHDIKVEKVFATYKGRTLELAYLGNTKFGFKALLINGQDKFWVNPSEVQVATVEPEPEMPVSNDDIKLLISALSREESLYRKVTVKPNALASDKKLAKQMLVQIKELRGKLEAALD